MLTKKTVVLALALGITVGACGSASTQVTIEAFAFEPADLRIESGTTVRWRNADAFRHTVTSGATSGAENQADGRFDLDLPEKGSTATFTFEEPGTYTYFCRQHNAMDGTVTVS